MEREGVIRRLKRRILLYTRLRHFLMIIRKDRWIIINSIYKRLDREIRNEM